MASLNVEILNPKAQKLLRDLADLKLISITDNSNNPFLKAILKLRSKKALSIEEITKEVEAVRSKRHGK